VAVDGLGSGMTATPLAYLTSAGTRAAAIVPLTCFLGAVSVVVCLIIAMLLWLGIRRGHADTVAGPVVRGGDGLGWIKWGMALSAVPLAIGLIWTMAALGQIVGPPRDIGLTIDVTARQWWWEVRYPGTSGRGFATANEFHIPTGTKVLVRLHGPDVIHSFWVPQLSGKTDVIPGQTNLTWLGADRPGRYRGQCAEYCGLEHAKMALEVVAEPPAQFDVWRRAQLRPAALPVTADTQHGLAIFRSRCAQCHVLRGFGGRAEIGPDLTHLMSRATIAAGSLGNSTGNLAGWIEDPQSIKPGARMPGQQLSGQELNDVVALLGTLE
jgi:cytochrome c oxidase subunit 2